MLMTSIGWTRSKVRTTESSSLSPNFKLGRRKIPFYRWFQDLMMTSTGWIISRMQGILRFQLTLNHRETVTVEVRDWALYLVLDKNKHCRHLCVSKSVGRFENNIPSCFGYDFLDMLYAFRVYLLLRPCDNEGSV